MTAGRVLSRRSSFVCGSSLKVHVELRGQIHRPISEACDIVALF